MIRELICLLVLASASSALPAYEVTINYNDGEFTLLSLEEIEVAYLPDRGLEEATYETQKKYGGDDDYYTLTFLSYDGDVFTMHDRYPVTLHYDNMDVSESRGGLIELDNVNNSYIIPRIPEPEYLSVSDNRGNEVYTTGLSGFLEGGQEEDGGIEPPAPPTQEAEEPLPVIPILMMFVIALMAFFIWQSRRG